MKTLIPWILAVAMLGAAGVLYSAGQKKDKELAALRASATEADQLRARVEELEKSQVSQDEITRLRKEAEDVLRLRSEIKQLRDANVALNKQVQTVQSAAERQVERANAETERARAQAQRAQTLTPQQQAEILQSAKLHQGECTQTMKLIGVAKTRWAQDNSRDASAVPTAQDIAGYFEDKAVPSCPGGGRYTLNAVGALPACSLPGHGMLQ
jgi:DNA repair ATPase RecN